MKSPVTPERRTLRADSVIGTQSSPRKSNSPQDTHIQSSRDETPLVSPTKAEVDTRKILYLGESRIQVS